MSTQRKTYGVLGGAILALAIAVLPVRAQEDARMERIRAELPEAVAQEIVERVAEARANGLPAGVLLDKAVEGIAKRVPGPRIAGAVGLLAQELGRAQTLLRGEGPPPPPTDVAAVADAMRRGVPEPAIQRVTNRAGPQEPVALAVHTLGDLMDRGVPVDQAVAVLDAWRGRGADRAELRQLPAAVDRLVRQGVLPAQAAAAVANAMRGGPPGGQVPGRGQGRGPGMMDGGPPIPPGAGPPDERGRGRHGGGPPGGGPPGGGPGDG